MSQEICPQCKTTNVKKAGESSESIIYSCVNDHRFEIHKKKGGVVKEEKKEEPKKEEKMKCPRCDSGAVQPTQETNDGRQQWDCGSCGNCFYTPLSKERIAMQKKENTLWNQFLSLFKKDKK